MPYTRRHLLGFLGGISGLSLMPSHSALAAIDPFETAAATLRRLLHNPAAARGLGRSYRIQYPNESNEAVLVRLILGSLSLTDSRPESMRGSGFLAALDARVRTEFKSADTVQINSWVLARTEGRLCALCR